jgi:hypothetical protein
MKDLEKLRKLMLANGLVRQKSNAANSMEIVPFGKNLFELDTIDDKKKDDLLEGSTCEANGCNNSSMSGCGTGCLAGCSISDTTGISVT